MACVILELMTSGSCIPEERDFVKELREVCDETGTLLIFDEVITGFRVSRGETQLAYEVTPDLTTFGKAIGGGAFAAGGVGGRADVMDLMNFQKYRKPTEHVAAGGTYVGNPLMARAGYEAMKVCEEGSVYPQISKLGQKLTRGLQDVVDDTNASAYVTALSSVVKLHFLRRGTEYKGVKSLLTDFEALSLNYIRCLVLNG
jgi:glutamate-1-semialdehyde 2,1-aminomutase